MNENNISKKYEGLKSSLYTCYYICFMPIIVILLSLIEKLITGTTSSITMMSGQFYLLLFLIPFAFLIFDFPYIIGKQKKFTNFKSTIKQHPELFVFITFIIWAVIATILQLLFFGKSKATSAIILPVHIEEGTLVFIYYLMILISAFFIQNRKIIHNMLFITSLISVIVCILTLIDPTGEIFWFYKLHNSIYSSFFVNRNHLGYYLSIFLPLLAISTCLFENKKHYVPTIIFLSFNLIILFLNNTLGAQLSIFLSFMIIPFALWFIKRKIKFKYFIPLITFTIISIISIFFANNFHSNYASFWNQLLGLFKDILYIGNNPTSQQALNAGTNRWELWLSAFKEIIQSPIIGTGNILLRPHNEYLQFAQVWGIPATLIYITTYIIILVKFIKYKDKLSNLTISLFVPVYTYLISALFGNTMPHTYPYFMLMTGFLIRTLNQDINKQEDANLLQI